MLHAPALDPAPLPLPSPADDWLEAEIDLNRHLIARPAATFLMRVSGCSMSGAGILDGDLVVVGRSLERRPGCIVIAVCRSELTLKRLRRCRDGRMVLAAEHPDYPERVIEEERPAEVWGMVVGCVRKLAV